MKTHTLLTTLLAAAALPLAAQTTPPVHHTAPATTPHTAVAGCAKLPELSPKIPALPPGTPCAKTLFRFTTNPAVKLDYASPLVPQEFREALGLVPSTFELDYVDTKVGNGELARSGMDYTLQYTGYLTDGTQFDTSIGKPTPFTFPIGQHKVIPGWELGFQGMRVGGKRRLFIPYQMAYGEQGKGIIPGHAELIFDIELLSQKPTETGQPGQPQPGAPGMSGNSGGVRIQPPQQPAPRPATPPPAGATPPSASTTPPPAAAQPATPPPVEAKPATPPPASTTPPPTKQ